MEVKRQKPEIKSRNLEKSACRSPHQSAGNCRYPCGQEGAHIQAHIVWEILQATFKMSFSVPQRPHSQDTWTCTILSLWMWKEARDLFLRNRM